ncbi:glycoside hydrolase family 3 N-terminal domain-containing protein, partial [Staphylococcus aureus]
PVVDVAVNPANPITNTRSFGADHELVARLGSHYVSRLERAGLMTSPKHFPGDGVDDRDQHLVTSSNDLDVDEWTRTFGAVYAAVIAA